MPFVKKSTWARKKISEFINYGKFFIIIFFCLISSINVHYLSGYIAFPLFFLVPLYYFAETQKKLPLAIVVISGVMHDFYLESLVLIYTFFFIIIYYSLKHFQRFILKSSPFKEWRFFVILCVFAFLSESVMARFIAHNTDSIQVGWRVFLGYIILAASYPIYKKPIAFMSQKMGN
jgi:cell shape-determining protein MreD